MSSYQSKFQDVFNRSTSWLISQMRSPIEIERVQFDQMLPGRFYYIINDGRGIDLSALGEIPSTDNPLVRRMINSITSRRDSPIERNVACMVLENDGSHVLVQSHNYMPYSEKIEFYKKWLYQYDNEYMDALQDEDSEEPQFFDSSLLRDFVSRLCRMDLEYSLRPISKVSIQGMFSISQQHIPALMSIDSRQLTGMDQEALEALRDRQRGALLGKTVTSQRQVRNFDESVRQEKLAYRLLRLKAYLEIVGLDNSRQNMVEWSRNMNIY